ncbi:MAG: ribosome maturation factor RimP [Bradymonadia bacterium]
MLSIEGIERLVEPVLAQLGLVLHTAELTRETRGSHGLVLRLVVDRAQKTSPSDGVTVDELAKASEDIGALLDLEDPIDDKYRLTLESPGVERDLTTWRHFRFAVGERVRIVTRGENAAVHEGELCAALEDPARLEVLEGETRCVIPLETIKSARTVFLWEDYSGKKRKF